jgi:regulator of sirC expression with transglutaminase-like and TPR domain
MDDLRERMQAVHGGGLEPSDDELRGMLVAAGKKDILARVLRNLKGIYLQKRELERALSASMRIIALDARAAEEYRDRGAIYLGLECFRAALTDYERYLQLRPRAEDVETVKGKIAELQQLASRLN